MRWQIHKYQLLTDDNGTFKPPNWCSSPAPRNNMGPAFLQDANAAFRTVMCKPSISAVLLSHMHSTICCCCCCSKFWIFEDQELTNWYHEKDRERLLWLTLLEICQTNSFVPMPTKYICSQTAGVMHHSKIWVVMRDTTTFNFGHILLSMRVGIHACFLKNTNHSVRDMSIFIKIYISSQYPL